MPNEDTGQGTPATGTEGGQAEPLATTPEPGAPETPQAGADTAALQAQLDEQRRIQAGLDKKVAQLTAQLGVEQDAKQKLAAQLEELQGDTTTGTEELESLRQTLAALEGEKAQWEQKLGVSRQHVERLRVVASEFPMLAPLVEAGALPEATDMDEFRQKLGSMAQAFTAQANATYQQRIEGIKPPASPPAAPAQASMDEVQGKMMAALKEGKMDDYKALKEQWYAAAEVELKKD